MPTRRCVPEDTSVDAGPAHAFSKFHIVSITGTPPKPNQPALTYTPAVKLERHTISRLFAFITCFAAMSPRGRSNSYIGMSSPVFVPRRRRYSEDSLRLSHIRSQYNLQATVSKTIIDRLAMNGVDTRTMSPVTIEHCLPIDNDWVSWGELLNNPLGVPDATLSKILRLRPVSFSPPWTNSKGKVDGDRIHVLYIRSFVLKVHELRDIIMRRREPRCHGRIASISCSRDRECMFDMLAKRVGPGRCASWKIF